jgi:copper chaperone
MFEKTFEVPDMSCAHCKAAVEGELAKLPGVERSDADVEQGTVEVSYDASQVGPEQIKGAIEEVGYTVAA